MLNSASLIGWAHPRLRGEHTRQHVPTGDAEGSSPLTRGALRTAAGAERLNGLIPAYAGSTDDFPVDLPVGGGLIPAYAGSTSASSILIRHAGAHPRLRGEHLFVIQRCNVHWGSSPLTRGAQQSYFGCGRVIRLIPAYAGSTAATRLKQWVRGAHPRLRGEHNLVGLTLNLERGSSPLTRGARSLPPHRSRVRGLIPAYAGSTTRAGNGLTKMWAHPRLRGEHSPARLPDSCAGGSSPLTRGARLF